jgi:hypothetical protein
MAPGSGVYGAYRAGHPVDGTRRGRTGPPAPQWRRVCAPPRVAPADLRWRVSPRGLGSPVAEVGGLIGRPRGRQLTSLCSTSPPCSGPLPDVSSGLPRPPGSPCRGARSVCPATPYASEPGTLRASPVLDASLPASNALRDPRQPSEASHGALPLGRLLTPSPSA